jgi:hypothetical protein
VAATIEEVIPTPPIPNVQDEATQESNIVKEATTSTTNEKDCQSTPPAEAENVAKVLLKEVFEEIKEKEKEPQSPLSDSQRKIRVKSIGRPKGTSSQPKQTISIEAKKKAVLEEQFKLNFAVMMKERHGLIPPPLQTIYPEEDSSSSTPLDTSSSPATGDTLSTPGIPESSSEERRGDEEDKREQAEFEAQEDLKEQEEDPDFSPGN